MRIVVAGGTGLIGTRLADILRARGHDALAASPTTGIDIVSGTGLAELLIGTDAVIDVSKPRTYIPSALTAYFTAAAQNLAAAEKAAGVAHHVSLAAVGTSPSSTIPYYRAKAAGEQATQGSGIPYTLVHATQFFEFAPTIAEHSARGNHLELPDVLTQPVAADDVARAVADIALQDGSDRVVEIAGPDILPMTDYVGRVLAAQGDLRAITAHPFAHYFGGRIDKNTLLPGPDAQIAPTRLDQWLAKDNQTVGTTR